MLHRPGTFQVIIVAMSHVEVARMCVGACTCPPHFSDESDAVGPQSRVESDLSFIQSGKKNRPTQPPATPFCLGMKSQPNSSGILGSRRQLSLRTCLWPATGMSN